MTQLEIKEMLERHLHWINEDTNGWEGMRADLRRADLQGADLQGADLQGANLWRADLQGADLQGAKIEEEILTKFFPICCPETGSFIGYKKAGCGEIVTLEISEDAKRSSAYGRKCRCSKAKVLSIVDLKGNDVERAYSGFNSDFEYIVGQIVEVNDFDENRWEECSTGIHFFITRQEAIDY